MGNSHKKHRMEPVAQLEPNFDEIVKGWSSSKIAKFGCGGHLGRTAEPSDTFLEENHPMTISSKLCSY
jgi:hypothetical protein